MIIVTIGSDDDPFDPENDRNLDNEEKEEEDDEGVRINWPDWESRICFHDLDCY